jgi:hypothetical protein
VKPVNLGYRSAVRRLLLSAAFLIIWLLAWLRPDSWR